MPGRDLPPLPDSVRAAAPDLVAWLWSAADTARTWRNGGSTANALGIAAATLERQTGGFPAPEPQGDTTMPELDLDPDATREVGGWGRFYGGEYATLRDVVVDYLDEPGTAELVDQVAHAYRHALNAELNPLGVYLRGDDFYADVPREETGVPAPPLRSGSRRRCWTGTSSGSPPPGRR
jgi:hypothetical protein